MREISFVNRLKFNCTGSIVKRALVLGDADNDQHNELVCASLQGDLAIFKNTSSEQYASASGLGMVTACLVGDVFNTAKNYVVAINTEGWLFIFEVDAPRQQRQPSSSSCETDTATICPGVDLQSAATRVHGAGSAHTVFNKVGKKLEAHYSQRMPANCKELLLADVDGDGHNELIVGLTDRVLRTYKWVDIADDRGKFVGLHKWEFADQIGAVSLNPSSKHDNCQDIIVAQPGGTYAKLECFDKQQQQNPPTSEPDSDENVKTEYISKLTPEYHQLVLAQMRNHHISTEVLGGIRDSENTNSLIGIATLDGTLMLVNKDEILWSLQVDHQLFCLATIELKRSVTKQKPLHPSDSSCTLVPTDSPTKDLSSSDNSFDDNESERQYFAACAWNGKTYIIDEERNYLRFKFDEAVSAFTAGTYHFDGREHSVLVYATFTDQIILYYDVILNPIRPLHLLEEVMTKLEHAELRLKLELLADKLYSDGSVTILKLHNILQSILYGFDDGELAMLASSKLKLT